MDARPSSEQRDLADAAERLATKLGPTSVGDLDDGDRRARLDAAIAQAGWRDLRGGSASEPYASGVEAAIVTRALARGACDTAFLGPVLANDLLRRAGRADEAAGRTVGVSTDLVGIAVLEPGADASAVLGIDVDGASTCVVLVRSGPGFVVADVELAAPTEGVDLTRPVAVPASGAVKEIDGATPLTADELTAWTAFAVALTAADLVGTMDGALALATGYAKERRQYGAPIGSFQAVQHMLAEAATLADGAQSAMIHAAWAVDAVAPVEARGAAAVAKAYAARAARTVCETGIQVHGGIGNTWECMAHVFLRRALLATELFGGDSAQLDHLAQQRWGATHGLQ
jgi:Acyl-CoA dehydrogenase, C-terminal domain